MGCGGGGWVAKMVCGLLWCLCCGLQWVVEMVVVH